MNVKISIVGFFIVALFLPIAFELTAQEPDKEKVAATAKRLEALYPKIPDNENAALLYEQAFKLLKDDGELGLERKKILCEGFAEVEPDGSIDPEVVIESMRFLDGNSAAIRKIREGIRLPRARYSVDLSKGYLGSFYHLATARQIMRMFLMEIILSENSSNTEGAVASLLNSIKFQSSLNDEPFLASYLLQIACQWMACDSSRQLICRGHLNEEDLLALSKAIKQMDNYQILKKCLQSEKISREGLGFIDENLKPLQITDEQKAVLMEDIDRMIALAEETAPKNVQTAIATKKELEKPDQVYRKEIDACIQVFIKSAQISAEIQLLTAAFAIERYRLKNGKLPKELKELVPAYLDAVPEDPFDSKPVRYKAQEKGYWLYSVGRDLEDNGGTPADPYGFRPGTDITLVIKR